MKNYNFKDLKQSTKYINTFEVGEETYNYKHAELIECQMTHIISLFLKKIGIKTVMYDYDEESRVSYCKSMVSKGEKLNEVPINIDDYNLHDVYFAMKKDIQKYSNYQELLRDLCSGYFIAVLLDDLDKNTGYIIKEGQISLTPYYDFGSFFSVGYEYNYIDYIEDIHIDSKLMEEFCQKMSCQSREVIEEYQSSLTDYIFKLYEKVPEFDEEVLMDCLPNIPIELLDNIINFDINSLIDEDYHYYSENSKRAIVAIFNTEFDRILSKVIQYKKLLEKKGNKK